MVWGLGNLLSDHPTGPLLPAASQDGAIVSVELTQEPGGPVVVGRPSAVPTWVDKTRGHVIRTTFEAGDPTLPASTRAALTQSHARTTSLLAGFVAG